MTNHSIKTLNVHELKSRMDAESDLCLIDVRELEEWNEVRIPGAHHIPKDSISSEISAIVSDKNRPVYLYCRGGVRSLYAGQSLLSIGYQEVYSLDGGIIEWAASGYPIEQ